MTTARSDTTLTAAQMGRLDGIAANDKGAKIVWWSVLHHGPVVRLSDGDTNIIKPNGRKIYLTTYIGPVSHFPTT